MKFLLNTVAMGLTVVSIFIPPLTQAEMVESISFGGSAEQAKKMSTNIVVNQ